MRFFKNSYSYSTRTGWSRTHITIETVEKPQNPQFGLCNYLIWRYLKFTKMQIWTFSIVSYIICAKRFSTICKKYKVNPSKDILCLKLLWLTQNRLPESPIHYWQIYIVCYSNITYSEKYNDKAKLWAIGGRKVLVLLLVLMRWWELDAGSGF